MAEINQTALMIATMKLLVKSNAKITHRESGNTNTYTIGSKEVHYSVSFNNSTKKYEIRMGPGTQKSQVVFNGTEFATDGQELKKLYNDASASFDIQIIRSLFPQNNHNYNL